LGDKVRAIILTQTKKVKRKDLGFYGDERSIDGYDYPIDPNSIFNSMNRGFINPVYGLSDREVIFFEGNPNPIGYEKDNSTDYLDRELKENWNNQLSGSKKRRLLPNKKILAVIIIIALLSVSLYMLIQQGIVKI
jgi:hypothetical protein